MTLGWLSVVIVAGGGILIGLLIRAQRRHEGYDWRQMVEALEQVKPEALPLPPVQPLKAQRVGTSSNVRRFSR
jgi:hypothetical protein